MMKLVKKYGYRFLAFGLTLVASGAATCGCYYVLHQPKVPQNLKKFSKN